MITLNLPPQLEQAIGQQAKAAGLSIENYLFQYLSALVKPVQSSYDVLMNMDYPADVAEIEEEPFLRQSAVRDMEWD